MGLKHSESLKKISITITERQYETLIQYMLANRTSSLSHLAREIFQAWIESYHKSDI